MFTLIVSSIGYCVQLVLLALVLRREFRRQLMSFTVFMVLVVLRDTACLIVNRTSFYSSHAWFDIYWTSEFVISTMYLCVIVEIAMRSLRGYPSIWRPASTLLSVVALALTTWTVVSTMHYFGHHRQFVMVGDQHLVLTITILVLLLLAISSYYRVKLSPLYRLVLAGIGIYTSIEVVANQVQLQSRVGYTIWDNLRLSAFDIGQILWIYAALRCTASSAVEAELIPQSKYDDLSPQIHDRLQTLNFKLGKLFEIRSR